jgi:hypothetical protein
LWRGCRFVQQLLVYNSHQLHLVGYKSLAESRWDYYVVLTETNKFKVPLSLSESEIFQELQRNLKSFKNQNSTLPLSFSLSFFQPASLQITPFMSFITIHR